MPLKWKHTLPEKGDDFTARDPDRPRAFCRIYLGQPDSEGRAWFWTASDGNVGFGTGYEHNAKAAGAAAERAYWSKVDPSRLVT